MSGALSQGHYLLGIEGLALLRAGAGRDHSQLQSRTEELRSILERLQEAPYVESRELPVADPRDGYARWASSYDEPGNDTIALEEPAVRQLLDRLPDGPVLDAACGTGRHAAYLHARGRDVIGVDSSEAMLARAADKVPGADLRLGRLEALPVEDGSVAGAVCALALSHLPDLTPPIAEVARVLQPGGRLVISNPHPFATAVLGWRAVFEEAGARAMIPEHAHLPSDYIAAFSAAGLVVRDCLELRLTPEQARGRGKGRHPEAFEQALTGVPAVIVWGVERPG